MGELKKEHHSCLYQCEVTHSRNFPKKYRFKHNIFMFYLDLDELPLLERKLWLFGLNRWNIFSFLTSDHYPKVNSPSSLDLLKDTIKTTLANKQINTPISKIKLLTHCRFLGYVFNPVSFYFCFDKENNPVACIAEVSNTFKEMKLFVLTHENLDKEAQAFKAITPKHFYVSPFTGLDNDFDISVQLPEQSFRIDINSLKQEELNSPEINAWITGKKQELNSLNLIKNTAFYPFMTFGVIFYIHIHAFILWIKGLKAHMKEEELDLQKGVINPHQSIKNHLAQSR